ncbi:MAG TPA: LPS assembly lipoprotein LptE [Caulobacteraceae bacterium]|jgi:LPS-assembly lipoprotein|nr:LPS assembly lipoprotein LptE [Caulobacteraceae bacterium]
MSGRRLAAGLIATSALALAACGFTPLYGTQGLGAGLAAIEVQVPHGRLAYLLGESLNDDLARDRSQPAAYRLDVTVSSRSFARGLNLDETAAYYEDHVTVDYKLVDIATGRVLKTGSAPIEVTYAATNIPYAGIAAQQDAQKRAADEAAQRIRTQLGIYFASLARE